MGKKADRQQQILARLSDQPTLRISELAEQLNVTPETIRRDFEALTQLRVIDRTYGGAMLRQEADTVVAQRHNFLIEERRAIAKRAAPLLEGARLIMLGSGATTLHMGRQIASTYKHMTAVVHSFGVATVLSFNPAINVMVAPGIYHPGEGAMHGVQTNRFLSEIVADWVVLGASGMTEDGPSDALIEGGEVYSTMIRQSKHRMLLADSSKFDRLSSARYAKWSDVNVFVTDRMPTGPLLQALSAAGTEILVANSD